MNKRDIQDKKDVENIIQAFYSKARKDELISHFFNEIVEIDWEVHIPRICSFWNAVLLNEGKFDGNPMLKHIALNSKSTLEKHHFRRWLKLWFETINERFEGPLSETAKSRADSIAQLMFYKVSSSDGNIKLS